MRGSLALRGSTTILVSTALGAALAGCQAPAGKNAAQADPPRTRASTESGERYIPPPQRDIAAAPPGGDEPADAAPQHNATTPEPAPPIDGPTLTLAELESRLSDIVAKQNSVHFVSNVETQIEASGYTMHQFADLTVEHVRTQDGWRSRMESRTRSVQSVGDDSDVRETSELKIFDGQHIYSMETTRDGTIATRAARDPQRDISPFDMRGSLGQMRQMFDLRALPEQEVDGQLAYAIEMIPRRPEDIPTVARMVQLYSKENAVNLKVIMYNAENRPYMTLRTRDIRVNEPISLDRFVFTAPAGVDVQEIGPGGAAVEPAPAAERPATPSDSTDRAPADG